MAEEGGGGEGHVKGSEPSASSAVLASCRATAGAEGAPASAQSAAAEADAWIVGSGAPRSLSPGKPKLCRRERLKRPLSAIAPGGQAAEAVGRGGIEAELEPRGGGHDRAKLIGALHADGARASLAPAPTPARRGLASALGGMRATITKGGGMSAEGRLSDASSLLIIKEQELGAASAAAASATPREKAAMRRRRLGHPSAKALRPAPRAAGRVSSRARS